MSPCACPLCTADALSGSPFCKLCERHCNRLVTILGPLTANVTRWRVHLVADAIEDIGGNAGALLPDVLAGRIDAVCATARETAELDRAFLRHCDDPRS